MPLRVQRDDIETQYTKANEELNKNREKMKACDEQISALIKEQAAKKQELADGIIQQKRLDNEVFPCRTPSNPCRASVGMTTLKHLKIFSEQMHILMLDHVCRCLLAVSC